MSENIENILLYEKRFDSPVSTAFSDEGLAIGSLKIVYEHDQDCCENVYADFSVMKDYIERINEKLTVKIGIKAVPEMGFIVFFYSNDEDRIGAFIPCHNSQNGYYSSDLQLEITEGSVKSVIDITDCTKDDIC